MKKPFSKGFGHKDEKNVSEEKEENNIEIGNQSNNLSNLIEILN